MVFGVRAEVAGRDGIEQAGIVLSRRDGAADIGASDGEAAAERRRKATPERVARCRGGIDDGKLQPRLQRALRQRAEVERVGIGQGIEGQRAAAAQLRQLGDCRFAGDRLRVDDLGLGSGGEDRDAGGIPNLHLEVFGRIGAERTQRHLDGELGLGLPGGDGDVALRQEAAELGRVEEAGAGRQHLVVDDSVAALRGSQVGGEGHRRRAGRGRRDALGSRAHADSGDGGAGDDVRRRGGGGQLQLRRPGGGDEARIAGCDVVQFGLPGEIGIGDTRRRNQCRRLGDHVGRQIAEAQRRQRRAVWPLPGRRTG